MQKNCYPKNLHFPGYNPVDAGMHTCPPGHSPRTRVRTFWLLHYVVEGKGVFQSKKGTYEVTAGQCFVIRPSEVTMYKADETDPWHYVWVGFTADSVPAYLHTEDVLEVPFLAPIFGEIEATIDHYKGEAGANGGKEAYLCGKITEIMMRLELHFARPVESKSQSEMYTVKNYIDTHLSSPLSVQALAEQFHLSSVYLSRRFKEVVGLSPQNYIVQKRLQEAAALMTVHGMSPLPPRKRSDIRAYISFPRCSSAATAFRRVHIRKRSRKGNVIKIREPSDKLEFVASPLVSF